MRDEAELAPELNGLVERLRSRLGNRAAASASRLVLERAPDEQLALAFLLMIGFALVADGIGFHIPRAYLYTAMAFSAGVEALNVVAQRNRRKNRR